MTKRPLVLSVVGKSDSGKTTLILKILPRLKKKGYKVAVSKHCPYGFDLDVKGKDSFRFTEAGGEGTFLTSKNKIALIRPKNNGMDTEKAVSDYFNDFDIVLMEGYNSEKGIKKIHIIRRAIGSIEIPKDDIIAYVSDMPLETEKKVFSPDDIPAIADFIVSELG